MKKASIRIETTEVQKYENIQVGKNIIEVKHTKRYVEKLKY